MACQMSTERKSFTFTWIIENFEYCEQKTGHFLKSPTFIVDTIDRSKWSLIIYPRGEKSREWISLYLLREEDCKALRIFHIEYELSFLAVDGSVLISHTGHKHIFSRSDRGGLKKFEERESVFANQSKFFPHGALTIRCQMWRRIGEVNTSGQCIARTLIGVERKAFLWKVTNFSSFNAEREAIYHLNSTSSDEPIMSLTLYYTDDPDCILSPYNIEIQNFISSIIFGRFKASIIDAEGNRVHNYHEEILPPPNLTQVCGLPLSKETFVDKHDLYLPQDTLTLYCEVAFSTGIAFEGIEGTVNGCSASFITNNLISEYIKTVDIKKSASNLKMDLNSMLQDHILCDIKLCVGPQNFPAHRFILSARSPVFRAMFQTDMKERKQGQVNIEDLKPDTVLRMLHFMYTDSLGELDWENASDLYIAAEKYQIAKLKEKCSSFLISNLNISNTCRILLLSDLHHDEELKSAVQGFIMRNDKRIINSNDWELLMKDNVRLAAETMLLKFKR